MPSERIQFLVETLLNDATESVNSGEWPVVEEKARAVLAIAPQHADALALLQMAQAKGGGSTNDESPEGPSTEQSPSRATVTYEHQESERVRRDAGTVGSRFHALASFGERVSSYLVDAVFFSVIGFLAFAVVVATSTDGASTAAEVASATGLAQFVAVTISWSLLWLFNSNGISPGKALVGTRIDDMNGGVPGARVGFTRTVVAVLGGVLFGIGYLSAAWHPESRTWHDRAAGTYVVRKKSATQGRRPGQTAKH